MLKLQLKGTNKINKLITLLITTQIIHVDIQHIPPPEKLSEALFPMEECDRLHINTFLFIYSNLYAVRSLDSLKPHIPEAQTWLLFFLMQYNP